MSAPAECPLCGKPPAQGFSPFCSRRCADIDLGRWLKGGYVIPADSGEKPSQAPPGPAADED